MGALGDNGMAFGHHFARYGEQGFRSSCIRSVIELPSSSTKVPQRAIQNLELRIGVDVGAGR
jgi:hypothetical protein